MAKQRASTGMSARRTLARPLRLAGLIALVLAAAGCWAEVGGTPDNQYTDLLESTITPATVGGLTPIWTAPAGDLAAVMGNHVIASKGGLDTTGAGGTAQVQGLDPGTGAVQWTAVDTTRSFNSALMVGTPAVVGDEVWY